MSEVLGNRTARSFLPIRFTASRGDKFSIRNGYSRDTIGVAFDSNSESPPEIILVLRKMSPPPGNDPFATADDLGKIANAQVTGNNYGATAENGEEFPWWREGDSVWTRWTAPGIGDYEIFVEGEVGLGIEFLKGDELQRLELIEKNSLRKAGSSYQARFRFPAIENEIYHVRVTGDRIASQGSYTLTVRPIGRPANDDRDQALDLTGDLPLIFPGDTRDGGLELPLENSLGVFIGNQASSIWWTWTAPATGFYVLEGEGELGIFREGATPVETQGGGHLYFGAEEGRRYEIRLSHGWSDEREVSLSLDYVDGLDHADRSAAVDIGNGMSVTSPVITVLPGTVYGGRLPTRGAAWFRWTPETSGWVILDSKGSGGPVDLVGYEGLRSSPSSNSTALDDRAIRERDQSLNHSLPRIETGRGFFRNRWLARPDKLPPVSRSVMEVEAGRTYFLEIAPHEASQLGARELVDVIINVRPMGFPPELGYDGLKSALSDDVRWLSVELVVESLNGFAWGEISWYGGIAGFGEGERIWGSSTRGVYRVLIPWSLEAGPGSVSAKINLIDQQGLRTELSEQMIVLPAVPNQETSVDLIGPELIGVTGGAREIELGDDEQTIEVELAIRDDGESGFEEGEILLPGDGEDYGADERRRIPFGAAQRVRGDSRLGVYRIEMNLPRWTPPGMVSCQLRDRVGNLGGIWEVTDARWPTGKLNPILPMAITLTRAAISEREGPLISNLRMELQEDRVSTSADLDHPIGIYGGQVVFLDDVGVVVTSVEFTPENRISGSEKSRSYQIEIPLDARTFDRSYRALWIALGADGGQAEAISADFVTVPFIGIGEERPPALLQFEASPTVFDLSKIASSIEVSLTAEDDLPGLVAEVLILDADSRELGRGCLTSEDAFLSGTVAIPLPVDETLSGGATGRIVVVLTDASGKQETYGQAGSRKWQGETISLLLNPDGPNALDHWSHAWLGRPALGRETEDSDQDGWSDLLEFAIGTDPTKPLTRDPLSNDAPFFTVKMDSNLGNEITTTFRPAPWFELNDGRIVEGGYELIVEGSEDLRHWTPLAPPVRSTDGKFLQVIDHFSQFHRFDIRARGD